MPLLRRKRWKKKTDKGYETVEKSIVKVFEVASKSSDFITFSPIKDFPLQISYFETLIDKTILQESVLLFLKEKANKIQTLSDVVSIIPLEGITISNEANQVERALLDGSIAIYMTDNKEEILLIELSDSRLGQRETNDTQNEFSVIGPKIGFIEDIRTNLNLIREQINTADLIYEEFTVGTRAKTKVVVAYLEGITNPEYVNTVRQRISDLDIDISFDNTQLEQLIADNSRTPFPLYISTERVDRAVESLVQGQVVMISDKSSYAIIGPATLMEFFSNPEDYYLPSFIASFFKLIRIIGMIFSIFASAFYVAILTYHFEVIPKDLLAPIIFSRANVPFPPVAEALFLEITIDLLREAGARLPSKIGQTLGIVGGIVIGQATVEAALTSTILLILVALAALSSFTTPIYKMSNAVRLLRYPFILIAAIWGGFGIFIGIIILIVHLSRLKSLGVPYLLPLYPYRKGGVGSSFIRPNYPAHSKRSWYLRPLSVIRYSPSTDKDPKEGLNHE